MVKKHQRQIKTNVGFASIDAHLFIEMALRIYPVRNIPARNNPETTYKSRKPLAQQQSWVRGKRAFPHHPAKLGEGRKAFLPSQLLG